VPTDFDEKAKTWDDDPAKVHRARVVAEAIRSAVPLGSSTRLLEYGAGTGMVSQTLADHVGPITLAEPSAGMRAVMVEKIAAGTLPAGVRIWNLDLATDEVPDERFDLIITVLTLRHIQDLVAVLDGFATLLSDGGHLCIVDLEEEDGSFHSSDPGFDGHHGFGRAALTAQLEAAGFVGVRFERCYEINKEGTAYPLFLATCTVGGR
jgi:ubiquinone/menaquinone biosynthesis C-methylase UbiE